MRASWLIAALALGWLGHTWLSGPPDLEVIPPPSVPPLVGPDKVQQAERLEIVAPDGTVTTVLWVHQDGRAMISVKDGKTMRVIDLARAARWMH